MRFERVLLLRGQVGARETVHTEALERRGLSSAQSMLDLLRELVRGGNTQGLTRGSVATGTVCTVKLGFAHCFKQPPAPYVDYERRYPDHTFTIEDTTPFLCTMVLPQRELEETERVLLLNLVHISAGGGSTDAQLSQVVETASHLMQARPAVVSTYVAVPASKQLRAEADGLATYLGACVLLGAQGAVAEAPARANDAAAPPDAESIPVPQISLKHMVELNRRSALILTGAARGSSAQARRWDAWVEAHRVAEAEAVAALAPHVATAQALATEVAMAEARWWLLPPGARYRFVSTYGGSSFYAIPVGADPVPNITEFDEKPSSS
jgi:hypothetical protein